MSQSSSSFAPLSVAGFPSGQFIQRQAQGGYWKGSLTLTASPSAPSSPAQDTLSARILDHRGLVPDGAKALVEGSSPAWTLELSGLPAGGPFILELSSGSSRQELEFFVGDLWLMAGQSNMEGVGAMEDAAIPHPLIRNLNMARVWEMAQDPLHFMPESPDTVHNYGNQMPPEAAREAKKKALKGSGVGIHFARQMMEITGVPQGLVSCAHGGTAMAQWDPKLVGQGGASLYGSLMLSMKLANQPLAGVLWYQGCSDANDPEEPKFTPRMVELVETLRRDLNQPELPWITVQIGTEIGRSWQTSSWHKVQEQQRLHALLIPHLDVCASADLEHDDWIHVSGKAFPTLARRMVQIARRLVLGQGPDMGAPQPLKARWAPDHLGPRIEIECGNVAGSLSSVGKPLGFTLADKNFKEQRLVYQVRYQENKIYLRLTGDDLVGLSVFHGLDTEPQINTYDARGLPVPVFGPLAIEGLPPVSAWFRSWKISPALDRTLASLKLADHGADASWAQRRFEGWNVINMKEDWNNHQEVRLFSSTVELSEDMELEVHAGGDGAFRVWLEGMEVINDPEETTWLGNTRVSPVQKLKAGRYPVTVAMSSRGGQAFGFYLRFKRLDAQPGTTPLLPEEGTQS